MNDIAKQAVGEKLKKAITAESVTMTRAAELLGLNSKYYPNMICCGRPEQYSKVSKQAWERVRHWSNTGERLQDYLKKYPELSNNDKTNTVQKEPRFTAEQARKAPDQAFINTKNPTDPPSYEVQKKQTEEFIEDIQKRLNEGSLNPLGKPSELYGDCQRRENLDFKYEPPKKLVQHVVIDIELRINGRKIRI